MSGRNNVCFPLLLEKFYLFCVMHCTIDMTTAGLVVCLRVKPSMQMFMQATCGYYVMAVLVSLILVCALNF